MEKETDWLIFLQKTVEMLSSIPKVFPLMSLGQWGFGRHGLKISTSILVCGGGEVEQTNCPLGSWLGLGSKTFYLNTDRHKPYLCSVKHSDVFFYKEVENGCNTIRIINFDMILIKTLVWWHSIKNTNPKHQIWGNFSSFVIKNYKPLQTNSTKTVTTFPCVHIITFFCNPT